jgi:hypothetical protein
VAPCPSYDGDDCGELVAYAHEFVYSVLGIVAKHAYPFRWADGHHSARRCEAAEEGREYAERK